MMPTIAPWIWGSFLAFILALLALDLGVFHRKAHKVEWKEALTWTGIWIGLALAFNAAIFLYWNRIEPGSSYTNAEAGMAFLAGYLVEKALSIDNVFVFMVVFSFFKVPEIYQHRVLFWGIIGALVFRAIFIALGTSLLEQFHWLMPVFGAFLIVTAIKLIVMKDREIDPSANPLVKLLRRLVPMSKEYYGQKFWTKIDGRWVATPLLLVLVVIEVTDLIFAVDSIPAILAITTNPFLVFTSNVFAILGLRALYFAVSGFLGLFHYLIYGLATILAFVGVKMMIGYWFGKVPVGLSLVVIVVVLAVSVLASIRWPKLVEVSGSGLPEGIGDAAVTAEGT